MISLLPGYRLFPHKSRFSKNFDNRNGNWKIKVLTGSSTATDALVFFAIS